MSPPSGRPQSDELEETQESLLARPHRPAPDDLSEVNELAARLVEKLAAIEDGDLAGEIVQSAVKLLRDRTNRGDLKLINRTLKEMRYALRVFAPYRDVRKVSIFGSARTPHSDPDYQAAESLAREIARLGWMVITGAGEGIMAAGHGGAGAGPSFGLAIRLPFEQRTNVHIARDKKLINFKYFFTRKLMFVRPASAVALFPGGMGTMDEAFEVLTLIQTGKSVPIPVVLVERPGGGYWKPWIDYLRRQLVRRGLVGANDLHLFTHTDDVHDAVRQITRFYSNYHSVRYHRGDLIVRLHKPLSPEQLDHIGRQFADISDSPFRFGPSLPIERNEPALAHLHRLVFAFNHRDQGRLRMLIDYLNGIE